MPRYRTAYPPEFRRQMVDLARSGRGPEELAREFEPTAQSISTWVKQAEWTPASALTGRPALSGRNWGRLRRENHRLRQERDILAKAAASFARGNGRTAERLVGGQHHLPADVGRLSLPHGRSRRIVAPDRRMGVLRRSEIPSRARRSRHGEAARKPDNVVRESLQVGVTCP